MNIEKRQRIEAAFEQLKADAIIATSYESTWYMSEAHIDTQKSIPDRIAAVLWVPGEEPTYIVCNLEEIQARQETWIEDIRIYFEFQTSPVQVIAQVLKERGLANATIGVEFGHLTLGYYTELQAAVDARFISADLALSKVRMVKTEQEIETLREVALRTEQAIWDALLSARPGMTEEQVNIELQRSLLSRGVPEVNFAVLMAGKNTCLTHAIPGPYEMKSGDVLRTDFGGVYKGYLSDLARTVVVGEASQKQRDIYKFMYEAHESLIDMMRPGVAVSELYNACKRMYDERGAWFERPHIGHSQGIGLHEYPIINPYTHEQLQPGMTMAIEPNYMIPGVEKYHLEDLVLITEDKPVVLSRTRAFDELPETGNV